MGTVVLLAAILVAPALAWADADTEIERLFQESTAFARQVLERREAVRARWEPRLPEFAAPGRRAWSLAGFSVEEDLRRVEESHAIWRDPSPSRSFRPPAQMRWEAAGLLHSAVQARWLLALDETRLEVRALRRDFEMETSRLLADVGDRLAAAEVRRSSESLPPQKADRRRTADLRQSEEESTARLERLHAKFIDRYEALAKTLLEERRELARVAVPWGSRSSRARRGALAGAARAGARRLGARPHG